MFRLEETHGRLRTVISIDGRLAGEYVPLVERACLRALEAGRKIEVFLRQVTAVDEAGRDLLRRLAQRGVELRALGLYMPAMLRRLRRSVMSRRRSVSGG